MMARLKSLFLLLAVSMLAAVGMAQFGAPAKEAPHARATLIADVDTIEPGKAFRLGVRFTMDPKWHIYWVNPGDTGLRTKIEWALPEGFTVGELHWPVPHHLELSGLISYAYEDEVVLYADVTPPAQLADSSVTLKSNASWLVCDTICIPGKAALQLKLPVGKAKASPAAALFDQYAAATPRGFFAGGAAYDPAAQPTVIRFDPAAPELAPDTSLTMKVTVSAPNDKLFDPSLIQQHKASLFPHVPSDFATEDPQLIDASPERLIFDWPISARSQAKPGETVQLNVALTLPLAGEGRVAAAPLAVKITGSTQAAAVPAGSAPEATATPALEGSAGASLPDSIDAPLLDPSAPIFSFLTAPVQQQAEGSLAYFLLLAFLGGLILNVMPCVLPVISLKVLGFVRQSAESPRRRLNLGLMFGVGVLVSFSALAIATIAVTAAGSQAGWGFQMTQPRFVMILAAIVLAFSLSLFGVFTVELPGRTANAVAQGAQGEGYGGSFMNGVLATLLATPCTAPFLAPASAFLLQQSAPVILLFFLTVGAGLAAPYIILAANPRLLRWMPKPGRWMETLKQLMGFALVATLIWLLWVLGAQVGNDALLKVMAWLVLVALGCWILGQTYTRRGRRIGWGLAAILIAGGYLLPESALQPKAVAADSIAWEPFSVQRVEELAAAGKTVFVDFTADWCVTCKANEQLVLETAPVREALRKHEVVALRGDWTNGDATISRVLQTFGSSGVPLYVIFPGGSPGEPMVLPSALTRDLVVNKLEAAARMQRVALN